MRDEDDGDAEIEDRVERVDRLADDAGIRLGALRGQISELVQGVDDDDANVTVLATEFEHRLHQLRPRAPGARSSLGQDVDALVDEPEPVRLLLNGRRRLLRQEQDGRRLNGESEEGATHGRRPRSK
jgi:hypothetical protein